MHKNVSQVIKGIISAKEEGVRGTRTNRDPVIYVQDSKSTIKVDIPFANENDFKVGDTVKLIIQQVINTK